MENFDVGYKILIQTVRYEFQFYRKHFRDCLLNFFCRIFLQNLSALTSHSLCDSQTRDKKGRKRYIIAQENKENFFKLLFARVLNQYKMQVSKRRIQDTFYFLR